MELVRFDHDHLRAYEGAASLPGMVGVTILSDDGRPLASGGTVLLGWGPELWIFVREGIELAERVRVARTAREYVRAKIQHFGRLYAHAFGGNERWLRWLGFDLVEEFSAVPGVRRWRVEEGRDHGDRGSRPRGRVRGAAVVPRRGGPQASSPGRS